MTLRPITLRTGRIVAALVGAVVGAVLGLIAVSSGRVSEGISEAIIVVLAFAGAALALADCCWRQPPKTPAH